MNPNAENDLTAPLDRPRENETRTKLIVNYLPQAMTDQDFFNLFLDCGALTKETKIVRHPTTGYSFGYGFVEYERPLDAIKALNMFNGFQIQNKTLKVSYSRPNSTEIMDTNLYINHLGSDITEATLEEMFAPFGAIIAKKIVMDPRTGLPKGSAFVRYSLRTEAMRAIQHMNGAPSPTCPGHVMEVRVADNQRNKRTIDFAMQQAFGENLGVFNQGFERGGGIAGRGRTQRFNPMSSGYGGGRGGNFRGRGVGNFRGRGNNFRGRGFDFRGRGSY